MTMPFVAIENARTDGGRIQNRFGLVAQQIVDARFGTCFRINAFHDDSTVKVNAVFGWHGAGHNN